MWCILSCLLDESWGLFLVVVAHLHLDLSLTSSPILPPRSLFLDLDQVRIFRKDSDQTNPIKRTRETITARQLS